MGPDIHRDFLCREGTRRRDYFICVDMEFSSDGRIA